MYGAQHEFILDDRDVDEYNMNCKFEQFAHLKQNIQKLIVYSTVETVLYIDRANLWSATAWTPGDVKVVRVCSCSERGDECYLLVPYTGLCGMA